MTAAKGNGTRLSPVTQTRPSSQPAATVRTAFNMMHCLVNQRWAPVLCKAVHSREPDHNIKMRPPPFKFPLGATVPQDAHGIALFNHPLE